MAFSKEATAYHEAGHAALMYYFKIPIQGIQIVNQRNGQVFAISELPTGFIKRSKYLMSNPSKIDLDKLNKNMRQYAIINLSGYAA